MPEWLDIDPAVLRQLALQHDQVAAETREWAQPPSEWLAKFEPTYGKIANPVKEALERYYDARLRAGEALAREHEQTAASLRESANAYERTDAEAAASVNRSGEDVGGRGGTFGDPASAGFAPTSTGPNSRLGAPVVTGPGAGAGFGPSTPPGQMDPAAAANGAGQGPSGAPPGQAQNGVVSGGATATPGAAPPAEHTAGTGTTPGAGAPAGTGTVPPGGALVGGPLGSGTADDRGTTSPPSGANAQDGTAVPVVGAPTPFNSAVASAKDKEAEPAYIVGDAVNEDLLIARTLLGAVLAATEEAVGITWAVAVLRGPAGAGLFITSNEGRGWLPAGLFLPRQVSTPWLWDELLGADGEVAAPWEGISDPARTLVEFGRAWGAKANAVLSAIASSGPIDPGLRSRLSEVAMQGLVEPGADLDLRVLTPDTTDRLGLTGSVPALESVAAVPDAQVHRRCVELALDAHAQVGRTVSQHFDSSGSRAIRDRILAKVEVREEVPASWWEELRDADDLLAAAMVSQRLDVTRVDLGAIRVDDEVSALRAMVWDRRCNELVALLAAEPNRQVLRDAVYAHQEILGHPSFVATPATVATGADEQVVRPAAGGSGVSAPAEQAGAPTESAAPSAGGPPSGAVVAPEAGGPPQGALPPSVTQPPESRGASS
ncbi:type VII secretion target [Nocardia sp. NPDC004568]|uniref:type VII secretion target n=1 Tax=Nocardia sp. NPDC004568 TaxID=3154551 RepID=UPI0033B81CB5